MAVFGVVITSVVRSAIIRWSAKQVLTGAVSRGFITKVVQERIMTTLVWSMRAVLVHNLYKTMSKVEKNLTGQLTDEGGTLETDMYIPVLMEVLNDDEVKKQMKELSIDISDEMAYEALGEMCIYLVRQAKLRAPVKGGQLKESINYVIKRTGAENELSSFVGPFKRKAPYRSSVEAGAKPHEIKPKRKHVLANVSSQTVYGTKVKHPGMKGFFYMQRTRLEEMNNALDIYAQTIDRRLKQ